MGHKINPTGLRLGITQEHRSRWYASSKSYPALLRGRTYRDALIMLEFMPYRSTGPITKVLRSAVANAEHNLGLDPSTLVISQASADMGPSMKRYRPRAQGRAFAIKKQTCHISIAVAAQTDS